MTREKRDLWENPPKGYEFMWSIRNWDHTPQRVLVGPIRKDGRRKMADRFQYADWTGRFSNMLSGPLVFPQQLHATEADAWKEARDRAVLERERAKRTIAESEKIIEQADIYGLVGESA